MSFWYGDADIPSNFTAAGGVAGLGEIWSAADKQMTLVDNTDARVEALNRAYDNRISAITDATGEKLEHPMRLAEQTMLARMNTGRFQEIKPETLDQITAQGPAMPTPAQAEAQKFSTRLYELEKKYPQFRSIIRADVPVDRDAQALAKKADDDLARLTGSRDGVVKFAATLGGGVRGSLRDPVQVATLFAGGGTGAGRTVLARIANMALKEALINGTVEAGLQPTVQKWREDAGLPHGFDEGVRNVLFATAAGGVLGGGAEAVSAGVRRAFTGEWLERGAEEVRKVPTLSPNLRRALDGDADAAIAALKEIRAAVSPEARAAIDLHEAKSAARSELPVVSSPVVHERNLDRAAEVARDPASYAPDFEIDRGKVDRIVAELVPDAPKKAKGDTDSLAGFLTRAGGIQDQKGEITALGLQNASTRFQGRLVRENGRTLDNAREIAAEAGYFNHRYGTAEEAVAKSTVADLLDELDAGSRRVDGPEDDGGRAYAESRVQQLLEIVGPEVDEKLIARAVQRAEADGIGLLEAFDQEASDAQDFADGAAIDISAMRAADPITIPGEHFEPEAIDESELFNPADLDDIEEGMTIPFFDDGRMATPDQVIDDLEALHALFNATEACRI